MRKDTGITANDMSLLLFISALGAFSAASYLATPASAGTYEVRSCDDAMSLPGTKADDAWQPAGDSASAFTFTHSCPSSGAQFSGQHMTSKLGLPLAERPQLNAVAEWRLTAPTGTTITNVKVQRDIGIRSNSMRPYGRTGENLDIDASCQITGENFTCDVGGPATPYFEADVNTTAVRWGIECWDTGTRCDTGSTLHNAWAMIYASTVTIDDPTAPTLTAVGGPAFSGGWKRGTVTATATATDTTGIKAFRWYRDATQVVQLERTCDYSRTVPCTNPGPGSSVALDTSLLADGSHTVTLAALDAAGNETAAAPQTVQVDNTAPAAPTSVHVTGGGSSPSFSVGFTVPGGQAAPVAAAHYRVCPRSGACQTGSVPVSGSSESIGDLTAAAGTSTVAVWLADEAGNADADNAATTTVTYTPTTGDGGGSGGGSAGGGSGGTPKPADPGAPATPPAPPGQPTEPTVPTMPPAPITPGHTPRVHAALTIGTARLDARGRLVVRGRLTPAASGRVKLAYRAKIRGSRRTATASAAIRDGRYRARLRLPRAWGADARTGRVIVRYAGSDRVTPQRVTLAVA